MIRMIKRNLIIPRGDTGSFSIPSIMKLVLKARTTNTTAAIKRQANPTYPRILLTLKNTDEVFLILFPPK